MVHNNVLQRLQDGRIGHPDPLRHNAPFDITQSTSAVFRPQARIFVYDPEGHTPTWPLLAVHPRSRPYMPHRQSNYCFLLRSGPEYSFRAPTALMFPFIHDHHHPQSTFRPALRTARFNVYGLAIGCLSSSMYAVNTRWLPSHRQPTITHRYMYLFSICPASWHR